MSYGYQVYTSVLIYFVAFISMPFFIIHLFVKGFKLPNEPFYSFHPILYAGMFFWDKYFPPIPSALLAVTCWYGAYIIYGGKDDQRR